MSRAFVKEDTEPVLVQRKRVAPAPDGTRLLLTLSGANRLREELQRLTTGPATAEIGHEIALIEEVLSRAEIVDARAVAGSTIRFGATVTVQDIDTEVTAEYQIVGEFEADLKLGRISVGSPLAKALIGREVGDLVQLRTPKGRREVEILRLRFVEDDARAGP